MSPVAKREIHSWLMDMDGVLGETRAYSFERITQAIRLMILDSPP